MTKLVGYELFLPAVISAIRVKDKDDNQLSESEIKAVVAVTFRDSVIQFMKDSMLYRTEIPIDLYEGVTRYDLIGPEGFHIENVVSLKEHKVNIPKHLVDLDGITLSCCPTRDIESAFFVEIALVPMRSSNCKFDEVFIDKYYDIILNQMFFKLTSMPVRLWKSLGISGRYQNDYMNGVNKAKRRALNGNSAIKLSTKRLSANVSSY